MLANEGIYTGSIDPTSTINPKILGSFYINTKTAKLFVCTDNTFNNNIWKICNPDIKIPEPDVLLGPKYRRYTFKDFSIKHGVWYKNTTKYPIFLTGITTYYDRPNGAAGDGFGRTTVTNFSFNIYVADKPMPIRVPDKYNPLGRFVINPELLTVYSTNFYTNGVFF